MAFLLMGENVRRIYVYPLNLIYFYIQYSNLQMTLLENFNNKESTYKVHAEIKAGTDPKTCECYVDQLEPAHDVKMGIVTGLAAS